MHSTIQTWTPSPPEFSSSRGVPIVLAVAFNLFIIYGLAVGIGVIPKLHTPMPSQVVVLPPEAERPRPIDTQPILPHSGSDASTITLAVPDITTEPPPVGPPEVERRTVEVRRIEPANESMVAPRLLSSVEPTYPSMSRLRDEEGVVHVRVTLSPRGEVVRVQIEKSSGFPRLDEAALKSVRGWKFSPLMRGGQAIAGSTVVAVRFRLEKN